MGAGNKKRIREGFRKGLTLEFFYFLFIATAVFLLKDFIMRLFVSGEGSEDVIAEGILYLLSSHSYSFLTMEYMQLPTPAR